MTTLKNTALIASIERGYFLNKGKRVKQVCVGTNLWGELTESGRLAWRYRFKRLATGAPTRMRRNSTMPTTPLSRSLLGVKRTYPFALHMSAFDPKQTWARVRSN
jgi:hypothetical protein